MASPRVEGDSAGTTLPSRVLHGHSAWVNALAVARDGRAMYTAGEDRRVCVFVPDDVFASGAGLAAWAGAGAFGAAAAASPTPGDDAAGACVALARVLHGHARPVLALALTSDCERLFSGGDDGDVRCWAVGAATPAPRAEAAADCAGIGLGLGLDDPEEEDDSDAAADDAACVARLLGHTGPVRCMALSPDGSALFTAGGGDCCVRRWDVGAVRRCGLRSPEATAGAAPPPTLHPTHAMAGHAAAVAALAFGRQGAWLLSASRDGSARLWDPNSGAPAALLLPPGDATPRPALEVLAVAPAGDVALTGAEDGTVCVWALPPPPQRNAASSLPSQPPRRVAPALALPLADGDAPVTALVTSHAGTSSPRAFAGAQDGGLRAWALSGAALRALWAAPDAHASCVKALALSPDGRTLYSGGFDALVRAWDAADGTPTATLAAHAWQVRALALSPAGATLYSAAADDTVRAWALRPPRAAAEALAALVSSLGSSLALPAAGERSCGGGSMASAAAAVQAIGAYDVAGALNDAHAWGSAAAQYAAAAAAAAPAAAALAAADAPGPYDVAASLSAMLQQAAQHSGSDDDDSDPSAAPLEAVAKLAATADAIGAATSAAALTAAAEAAIPAADAAARETLNWALKSLRTGAAAAAQTAAQTVAAAATAAGAPPAPPGPALTVDGSSDADVAPMAWHTFRGEVAGGPVGGAASPASPASPAARAAGSAPRAPAAAVAAAATSALGDISAYFLPVHPPGSPLTPAAAAAATLHPLMDDAHAL
jgi:WD40 repeat protein